MDPKERIEQYQASHQALEKLQREHLRVNEAGESVRVLSVDVPADAFYKDRINSLAIENETFRKENNRLNRLLEIAAGKIREKDERIAKLEKAFIRAAIE